MAVDKSAWIKGYPSITVRLSERQVSFCSSQQLVSVKNELLQYFMQISELIFQFPQYVRRLCLLRTLQGKLSWQLGGWHENNPTWIHILAPNSPNKEFLIQHLHSNLCVTTTWGTKFLWLLQIGGRCKGGLCITAKTVDSNIWLLYKGSIIFHLLTHDNDKNKLACIFVRNKKLCCDKTTYKKLYLENLL